MGLLRIVIAILAAATRRVSAGGIRQAFRFDILLNLLGYIPGIVHTNWNTAKR